MRRYVRTLVVITILVILSVSALYFQTVDIGNFNRGGDTPLGLNLGLDLQGGSHLVYQTIDQNSGDPIIPEQQELNALKRAIERRVNSAGLGQPIIQTLGNDRLLIQLPGIKDTERAKQLIGETAQLVYKHRELKVPRIIPEMTGTGLVGIKIVDIENAAESSTGVPTNETPAASATSTTTTVTSSKTGSSATSTEQEVQANTPKLPSSSTNIGLMFEFHEDTAQKFAALVSRLLISLQPIPGTERMVDGNPVPGTGDIYANFITVSATEDTKPSLEIPYLRLLQGPYGQTIPISGEPLIKRVDDSNSFIVQINGVERQELESRFEISPDKIIIGEILGKVDHDIPGDLTGDDMARAYSSQHQATGLPIVNIEFNSDGARKFGEITTKIAGKSDLLAVFLDDKELIASTVKSPILGGAAYIEGRDFTFDRVQDLALLLESGRLPVPIQLIQERNVDAILGADSLAKSTKAGFIGLVLVLIFMVVYYRIPGFMAACALLIYGVMLLAIFKMLPVTLTLSGVAAAILSIGMAVDANILIFERMKEELRSGRTLLSAINIGFNRAWAAIRDSNVSTLITCAILFWFADTLGASIVKGFAITLAIGVGLSMFSAITISRTLLRILATTRVGKNLSMFVPSGRSDLPTEIKD